mmetsp:Transcript_4221/g.26815  ORF Transcript_4221/g.26815 Transcript_4221/m.26815 type:complete len:208 (+) Transcript_4221:1311-1934(+)
MPASEEMVCHKSCGGDHHEAVADPDCMGNAPDELSDHLGMSCNADDPRFPQVHFWFVDGRNLEYVEGGWIQEQERHEGHDPHHLVHPGQTSHVPEADSIVPMVNEVHHCSYRQGQAGDGEGDPVRPGSHPFFGRFPSCCHSAVHHGKDGEQPHDGCFAVSSGPSLFDGVYELPSVSMVWIQPSYVHGTQGGGEYGTERDPRGRLLLS